MALETSCFTPLWMRAAARHQDENSTTECLVLVLRLVAQFDKRLFSEIIAFIFEVPLKKAREFAKGASVRTQEPRGSEEGPDSILDIEITSKRFQGIIEVKVGSRPTVKQLAKYRPHMASNRPSKLALLTVTTLTNAQLSALGDVVQTRWSSLGIWLETRGKKIEMPAIKHLVGEFVLFLRERGMVPNKVDASLVAGVQALENLLSMLEIALRQLKAPVVSKETKGWDQGAHYMGFAIDLNSKKNACWVGVYFGDPNVLRFMTERRTKIDAKKVARLGGNVIQGKWVKDKKLDDHFFNLLPDEQTEEVRWFIEDSRKKALKLTL